MTKQSLLPILSMTYERPAITDFAKTGGIFQISDTLFYSKVDNLKIIVSSSLFQQAKVVSLNISNNEI